MKKPEKEKTWKAWGFRLLGLSIILFFLAACAEVTRPTPTEHEQETAQLAAVRRHPYQTWAAERVSRVFLRLLPCLPRIHGRTYPFLGFNWWVTATGKVAVDYVWHPSPASEAHLQAGDVILAVNNWPLPVEVAQWNQAIRTTRGFLQDFVFFLPVDRYKRYRSRSAQYVYFLLPGELLPAIMLDLKHIDMEARGRYLTGPVDLLVQREERKFTLTLYPQHLPAEYAILVNTTDRTINAYAAPGQIILSQRMVNFCINNDELSLVVGHELAHQALGHLVRGAAHKELGKFLGEAVTAVGTLSLNRLLDWRHFLVDPNVRRVSQDAVVSVFSRDEEREADIYGAWYAFRAGFNIDKGLAVWERMAAVKDHDPFERTYFLDSHPAPLERLARLQKVARYFKAGRGADIFLQTADLDRKPLPD